MRGLASNVVKARFRKRHRGAKQCNCAAQRGQERCLCGASIRTMGDALCLGTPGVHPSANLPGAVAAATTFLLRKGRSGMLRVRNAAGLDICLWISFGFSRAVDQDPRSSAAAQQLPTKRHEKECNCSNLAEIAHHQQMTGLRGTHTLLMVLSCSGGSSQIVSNLYCSSLVGIWQAARLGG